MALTRQELINRVLKRQRELDIPAQRDMLDLLNKIMRDAKQTCKRLKK